jgi:hypothetical protein
MARLVLQAIVPIAQRLRRAICPLCSGVRNHFALSRLLGLDLNKYIHQSTAAA